MASRAEASMPSLKGVAAAAAAAALGGLLLSGALEFGYLPVAALVAVVALVALAVIAWHVDPAYVLIGALILSAFNNHWDAFGLPPSIAPDRFLLVAGLVAVLLRCPPARDRPDVPVRGVHVLLALFLAWAVGSAIAAGTLTESVCLVAAAIAFATWRRPAVRLAVGAVGLLCAAGLLLTLTRSVWIASVIASLTSLAVFRETRRLVIPAVAGTAALSIGLLAVFPQLEERAAERKDAQRSVSERRNVNAAALAMVGERPLLGFGWSTFRERNDEYFPLLDDVPQTAERRLGVHNVLLTFATELGLIGATLFALGFLVAVGRAVCSRGPPELRPWRIGLLAIALFWLVVGMFAPLGQVLPTFIPWLWAGIVLGPVLLAERS